MARNFTIKDVAKDAGVSIATVSLVVNNKEGVKPKTRARVLEAVERLHYTPNASARKLIDRSTKTIGLVVTDVTNPFFGAIISEINQCVTSRGYFLSLVVSNDSVLDESKCIKRLQEERVEGLIIIPSINCDFPLTHYEQLEIPFVFMTTYYEKIAADCVMCDLEEGAYQLTKYFLQKGRKKIFFVGGEPEAAFTKLRLDGYLRAYAQSGCPHSADWIFNIFPDDKAKEHRFAGVGRTFSSHFNSGYEATGALVAQAPDAILTINDQTAMGVLKYLTDHDIRVPEDIWLAGYDDVLFASLLERPLTTVRQPVAAMAEKTVDVLLERMADNKRPAHTYFVEPILKLRSTTK